MWKEKINCKTFVINNIRKLWSMINRKETYVEIDKVIHNDLWQFSFWSRRREQFSSSSNNSLGLLHDLDEWLVASTFASPLYLTIAAWPRNAHVNFILVLHSAIKLTAKNIHLDVSMLSSFTNILTLTLFSLLTHPSGNQNLFKV